MSVVDVLARSEGAPGQIALADRSTVFGWEELDRAVSERAAEIDAAPGSVRTLVTGGVDAATVIELLACWRAGVVPAPLNGRLSEAELRRARSVLAESPRPGGTQVVLWTSGTSGRPRGVALSFENLEHLTRASARRLGLGTGDVWLASLSPAHVGGLVLLVRSLLLGGTLVAPAPMRADGLGVALGSSWPPDGAGVRPTHVSLVPIQLLRLLDESGDRGPPNELACVLVGGAHAPAPLVDRATATGWPIALTYGCTEMSSQIATAPPDLVRAKPGTVGVPLAGVELRIAEGGEILARGPTRALGYVGGSEGGAEGWYATGDLGRIDRDGHLWITGRRMDRIVTGGVTIDAIEVEEAVRAHPSVADVCVVGVPDAEWGERVGALVVPVEGEFDPDEVDAFVRGRLMRAKSPTVWNTAKELPCNANGKVDRAAARSLLVGGA